MDKASKIGIIGKGNVGSALQRGLTRAGYQVQVTGKQANQVAEVGNWSDLVVLAVPYGERKSAVKELGESVRGKPLIDVTNAVDKEMEFTGSLKESGAEELQRMAKGARVVKAFNTVFAQNMERGAVGGEPLTLFTAGDDEQAKRQVMELGEALGFDAIDAGPLEHARWLEPLGYLNMALAFKAKHGPNSGFRFVHPGASRGTRPAASGARKDHAPTSRTEYV